MSDPVVVTGMGAITALGNSPDQTWAALLRGERGIRPIRRFQPDSFPVRLGAEIAPLDAASLDRAEGGRVPSLQASVLLHSARAALGQAGLGEGQIDRAEIAFFAGLGAQDYDVNDLLPAVTRTRGQDGILDYAGFFREHYRQIPPLFILTMLNNIAFCQVAIALGIRGENSVLSQYADAGAQAIAEAVASVREGRASVALAGGSGEELTAMSLARGLNLGVFSEGSCRPFAADRNGTLPGEGGGVLVLEPLSRARRRNARCLAEVSGFGSAGELDGAGSAPTVAAIRKAIESALSEARLAPETIDLIIGNGDGGREADRNEMLAIEELFGASLDRTPVVSFKGTLGHLFAGAPLVDAALGILAIRDGVVPAMAAGFTPDPAFHATLPVGDPLRKVVRRVLVNAQGFAGQSASIVLSRVPEAA